MKFSVVSIMPELVTAAFQDGLIGQAIEKGFISVETLNPRKFVAGAHRSVDDRVFGGSDGMLFQPEPVAQCLEQILSQAPRRPRLIHLSPTGKRFDDVMARAMAKSGDHLVLIASRYAGIDRRLLEAYDIEEISIGDYILNGGELPACIVIEAVARHLPGVLGNFSSSEKDSFTNGLLEAPQYTRPRVWRGKAVPEVLLCGDQKLIEDFQMLASLHLTCMNRPDLLQSVIQSKGSTAWISDLDAIDLRIQKVLREPGLAKNRQEAANWTAEFAQEVRRLLEAVLVK